MGTGTGTNQIWVKKGGKHKTWGHKNDNYVVLLDAIGHQIAISLNSKD